MPEPNERIEKTMTTRANLSFRLPRVIGALALCLAAGAATAQQSPFSAAVTINSRTVTYYEINQRAAFLELLNAPGNLTEQARETLIEERLQAEVGDRFGLTADAEQIEAGMDEFAARANMDVQTFLGALQAEGISEESFRDFVAAGVTWRNVVRQRFGPRSQVTEEEIDRALTLASSDEGAQINFAELVIPVTPETTEEARARITQLAETLDGSIGGFSAAAREYSASGSAQQGGGLGWRPLSSIPPQLRAILLPMAIGGVTEPVPLGNAVAIFQLRGLQESGFVAPEVTAVEYAEVLISGGAAAMAEAVALRDSLDTCDDLYGQRPGGFTITSLPVADVPGDITIELARLDANEVSMALTRANGTQLLFVMLCGRSVELPEGGREEVRSALFQARIESYANGYLAELRADAIIDETP
jgi:peptidyl-prolyl cis-trans isomerase SurA